MKVILFYSCVLSEYKIPNPIYPACDNKFIPLAMLLVSLS